MAEDKDGAYSKTLLRGLDVLSCFTAVGRDLSVSEIARLAGMPQATAWRFCRTLANRGYLVTDASGTRFRPGTAVLSLGFAALSAEQFSDVADRYLEELANSYHAAAGLAEPRDGRMLFVFRRQSGDAFFSYNIRVGTAVPVATSGSGWAYLASLPRGRREELLAAPAADTDESAPGFDRAAFEAALDGFGRHGVMVNHDAYYPGLRSAAGSSAPSLVTIACPVPETPYILYCTGLRGLLPDDDHPAIAQRMTAAARGISVATKVLPTDPA